MRPPSCFARLVLRLLSWAPLGFAAGCVTPVTGSMRVTAGPLVLEARPDKARLVFVRPDALGGSAVTPFYFDTLRQLPLGKAVNGTAFAVDVEPGDYHLCGAYAFPGGTQPYLFESLYVNGARAPLTRLRVVAGRSYLLHVVNKRSGIEAQPLFSGGWREHRLRSELLAVRVTEPVPEDPEFKALSRPEDLADWTEFCHATSSEAVRLTMQAADGKER